jgi:hypothetical protein
MTRTSQRKQECNPSSTRICAQRRTSRAGVVLLLLASVWAMLWSVPAGAQTITLSGTTTTPPFREFATRELADPWDMSQRTDIGWLTWGVDESSNLAGMAFSGGIFSATPSNDDPHFYLLDTWQPGSAKVGKLGVNYPIDTAVYSYLIVKMKIANAVLRSQLGTVGLPQAQIYWTRNTAYYDAIARPDGGFMTTADASGNPAAIPLTWTSPTGGATEGGTWVIYRIPLTISGLQSLNGAIAQWKNINPGATSSNWGTGTADAFRFDPINISGSSIGELQFDWVRLVSYSTSSQMTVNWTGGGTFDVVVSNQRTCSDFAVVAYSATTGYQFPIQMLPPGTYYVGLRTAFTGNSASAASTVSCSAGTFTVQSYPSLTMTSPNVEGSTDDFATAQLGDAWDFDALTDFDYGVNVNTPDATYGIVTKAATDPAGNDLGTVRVYRNQSTASSGVGDPHLYMLWPTPEQTGARFRGKDYRIDTSRYRILTTELGVERTRDLTHGSIARLIWHVDGELKTNGNLAEIESSDIVLRHLDPATQNGGKIVLDTIQVDMADRASLPVETDYPQPGSGWNNSCAANPGTTTCDTSSGSYKAGVNLFRLDFHEFSAATDSDVRRIKLAALERTGSSFQIQWTPSNPSNLSSTVTLKAVKVADAAAGNYRPLDATCSTAESITIKTGVSLSGGSYTWTPGTTAGLINGSQYYVCAQIVVGSTVVDEEMSRWPVVVDTAYTGLKPLMRFDRSTLRFTGLRTGSTSPVFSSKTPAETVRIAQSGSGTVNWTVSVISPNGGSVSWLTVSPTSGTGSGTLSVGLADDPTLLNCTDVDALKATIKLSSSDMGDSPQYIQVYGTMYWDGGVCPTTGRGTAAPFGMVDTPTQNATGVVGSVGVTGWAMDDVGIASVKLYRNCLAFEPAADCQWLDGVHVVYMGDADIVPGARPDVEAAYPTYPQAYRAGWGYLLLTNMLPHIPRALMYGGQGSISMYVFATDVEGHRSLLGRSPTDQIATTITMSNDSAAKPFGAIDTPGQGQTVSGALWNFGWALTPDTNTAAGAGDIEVSTTGGTMWVWIDGAPVGTVSYNQCRGSVGSTVPAGQYCDDDVANIFGNPTPQATYTVRLLNPTKYRNLDTGRGAMGAFYIDTTALSNGRHSIVWSVTDSAGRVDGIGSRDFIVFNGSSASSASLENAPRVLGDAAALAWQPVSDGSVWGRSGFDPNTPWTVVEPSSAGRRDVRLPEMGRLELFLGADVTAGYLVVNGTLRDLPSGSQLASGHFTWAPSVGYVGVYELVFSGASGQLPVTATIHAASDAAHIEAYIDAPHANATVSGTFGLAGWAADPTAFNGTGVGAVHVWALRRDATAAPVFLGAADLNAWRPDVSAQFGAQFEYAGWNLTVPALPAGKYEVTAYFWSNRTQRFEDARAVRVTAR